MIRSSMIALGASAALCAAAQADVSISARPTKNMNCASGVCVATAKDAVLNAGDLTTMLAAGDATVETGSATQDISIDQTFSWSSTNRLTLDAQRSVIVGKPVSATGRGGMTIVTNDKGAGGDFIFSGKGSVQFWDTASSLIINGNTYTLVASIQDLANGVDNDTSNFFALAKPYDAGPDGTYSGPPIDFPFDGVFEGLGNYISNLSGFFETDEPYEGFFSGIGGSIRDFGLKNANISSGDIAEVGILAGISDAQVVRCWATGKVASGGLGMGGLIGLSGGPITNSWSDVAISGFSDNSLNIGGIAGENDSTIGNSFSLGRIIVSGNTGTSSGGLVGLNKGPISNSFARVMLHDELEFGGSTMGGLVGNNTSNGHIASSYSAAKIRKDSGKQTAIGGVIGSDGGIKGNIASTYWDLDLSAKNPAHGVGNIPNDPGITGLSDAALKSGLPDGFDPAVWGEDSAHNKGYPYLLANPTQK